MWHTTGFRWDMSIKCLCSFNWFIEYRGTVVSIIHIFELYGTLPAAGFFLAFLFPVMSCSKIDVRLWKNIINWYYSRNFHRQYDIDVLEDIYFSSLLRMNHFVVHSECRALKKSFDSATSIQVNKSYKRLSNTEILFVCICQFIWYIIKCWGSDESLHWLTLLASYCHGQRYLPSLSLTFPCSRKKARSVVFLALGLYLITIRACSL